MLFLPLALLLLPLVLLLLSRDGELLLLPLLLEEEAEAAGEEPEDHSWVIGASHRYPMLNEA